MLLHDVQVFSTGFRLLGPDDSGKTSYTTQIFDVGHLHIRKQGQKLI